MMDMIRTKNLTGQIAEAVNQLEMALALSPSVEKDTAEKVQIAINAVRETILGPAEAEEALYVVKFFATGEYGIKAASKDDAETKFRTLPVSEKFRNGITELEILETVQAES